MIPLSITFLNPKILGFLFPTKNSLTWGVKCENETSENRREFIKLASKFVREWNGHLEIFSLPQVIENSRQYLLLRTDILQKTVVFLKTNPAIFGVICRVKKRQKSFDNGPNITLTKERERNSRV